MRPIRAALFWLALPVVALAASVASAGDRLAIVIGNGAYEAVTPLDNPASDARLIAASLEDLGFEVSLVIDAGLAEMNRAVAEFGRRLREAGPDATGLFYYAGHGVQSFGANYLLPTDTYVTNAADLDFVALEASTVLRQMFAARNRTNIVILDACRNNPFAALPDFGGNGLAEMKAPTGTFLAYATEPGGVALDGAGGNSPFSQALAREMRVPGRTIEDVFRTVRTSVLEETAGAQTPWDTSSITEEFFFAEAEPEDPAAAAAARLWESVRATNDPLQIMLYLRGYGDSPFAGEARELLSALVLQDAQGTAERPPAPMPQSQAPVARETELIEQAQISGEIADYLAYLEEFPDGAFAELARTEIEAEERLDPLAGQAEVAALPPEASAAPDPQESAPGFELGGVAFNRPLVASDPALDGSSLAELILGSPLYPPIEGLPEELWQGQTCANCHQWTREDLCTQGTTYLGQIAQRSLAKEHPYGGGFKRALRVWAQDGCP